MPLANAAAGGEESRAPLQNIDGSPPPGDAAELPKDSWQIRGDRVIRIVEVPRTNTCGPSTEPEPCPLKEEQLTEKRVTVMIPVDGTEARVTSTRS